MAPLRSVLHYTIDKKEDYEKLILIYGCRTCGDLCYMDEFTDLKKRDDVDVHLSIDVEEEGWDGFVGFVPTSYGGEPLSRKRNRRDMRTTHNDKVCC